MSSWSDDTQQLLDFAEALVRAGVVEDIGEVMRKPYKYTPQYEAWVEADFPQEDDENWDEWVQAVSETEEE